MPLSPLYEGVEIEEYMIVERCALHRNKKGGRRDLNRTTYYRCNPVRGVMWSIPDQPKGVNICRR